MKINVNKLKKILLLLTCYSIAFVSINSAIGNTIDSDIAKKAKETHQSPNNPAQTFVAQLKSMDSLVGRFTQVLADSEGVVIQKTKGKFKLKRPGYFSWETMPPYEQLVIGNPKNLWVYDPDLEQVTVHDGKQLANTPAHILSGNVESIEKRYSVTLEKNADLKVFLLKTKASAQQEEAPFATLKFTFKSDMLSTLELVDNLGQTTEVTFAKLSVNVKIKDNTFEFVPPPDTDVIINE